MATPQEDSSKKSYTAVLLVVVVLVIIVLYMWPSTTNGASTKLPVDNVPVGTADANTVPVGTEGTTDHTDLGTINTGGSTALVAPLVLYTDLNYSGTSRAILPGQKVAIAYIGVCDYNVPGQPGYDASKSATQSPGVTNGCDSQINPGWKYKSMKINPGTKLLFSRSAGMGDGNLGGSTYSMGLSSVNQIYNTDDLQAYLKENGGYDISTLALDRSYWPSYLYLQVVE
jgi:hypothetical protein